jgi:hypothetical protein
LIGPNHGRGRQEEKVEGLSIEQRRGDDGDDDDEDGGPNPRRRGGGRELGRARPRGLDKVVDGFLEQAEVDGQGRRDGRGANRERFDAASLRSVTQENQPVDRRQ